MIPHLLVLSDASTLPTLWGASRRCGRLTGIEVRNGLLLATLGVVKRAFDLSIALAALICGLPLIVGLMILVKVTSRGPIFFGHTRIGQHGKRFKAWKFRSMYLNADALLRDYLGKVAGAQVEWDRHQKLRRDPRVTRIGAFLRKTSFDELPQIWNVLKGDMSLVGPRPIIQDEVVRYGRVFRLYTSVKPGITGLWQVSGRNDIGYEERVQLDQFYVRHWSPWLDIYILGRTVITLLYCKGAY
jgi:Undecaprenyl-phosphate galactose phosphotransferase WbaP